MTTPTTNLSPAALEALARLALDDSWAGSLTDPTVRALAARFIEAEALLREIAHEAAFLVARLEEYEGVTDMSELNAQDWCGHVWPAMERTRDLAAKIRGRGR